jgi:cardiolipin synthase
MVIELGPCDTSVVTEVPSPLKSSLLTSDGTFLTPYPENSDLPERPKVAPRQTEDAIRNTMFLSTLPSLDKSDLVAGYPRTHGNKIELFVDGPQAFPQLFKDIDAATSSIHMAYYTFEDDAFGRQLIEKLIRAHERGVEVCIQMDFFGSRHFLPFSAGWRAADRLEEAGITVVTNSPLNLESGDVIHNIDHRKICVIDGRIAYTGGMNITKNYVGPFHDLMLRAQGPIVHHIQSEWTNSWLFVGGRLQMHEGETIEDLQARLFPSDIFETTLPGNTTAKLVQGIPNRHEEIYKTDLDMINRAEKSLHLEFPYLTDDAVEKALAAAARRGVDVRIVLPGKNDSALADRIARDHYAVLLESGCKIYEYPGFCHGKVIVADKKVAKLGSSNLDPLSMHRNYEMDLRIEDAHFAATCISQIFEPDMALSRRIKPVNQGWRQRALGSVLSLFATWS